MSKSEEILSINEIKHLVDAFYGKVRRDELLGPIFNEQIGDRWPEHLEKMYRFWQTVLLNEHSYSGSPFPPHARLPIGKDHFDGWLHIFRETVDENFTGSKAEEAKWRAGKMAEMFQYKIRHIQSSGKKSIY
ncbi:MAG: group III truncated hemoglobin [Cryomorphaceae bacterium]|nr:group III truncated hemoglobin [Flavobacteriales bacterium]